MPQLNGVFYYGISDYEHTIKQEEHSPGS